MKTLLILSANLCFITGLAQERVTTKKNFQVIENKQTLELQVKRDSLNKSEIFTNKKKPLLSTLKNNEYVDFNDVNANSKEIKTNTLKKTTK